MSLPQSMSSLSSMSTLSPLAKVFTTTLLAVTVCAICNTVDMVIPCHECQRSQCMACFSSDGNGSDRCDGCRMEHLLDSDQEEQEQEQEEEQEQDSPGDPAVFERQPYPMNPDQPIHLIEPLTMPFHGISYPSVSHWKQVEQILENWIHFATSSVPQKPQLNTRYLVGRTHHLYQNRAQATTDYLMSYEQNPQSNVYEWRRFMSTYYHLSPIPHDINLFYPYPLPLQFE